MFPFFPDATIDNLQMLIGDLWWILPCDGCFWKRSGSPSTNFLSEHPPVPDDIGEIFFVSINLVKSRSGVLLRWWPENKW